MEKFTASRGQSNKEESLEDKIIDYLVFAVKIITLLTNMIFALYRLSPRKLSGSIVEAVHKLCLTVLDNPC